MSVGKSIMFNAHPLRMAELLCVKNALIKIGG
nr:MAG TPA: hypothetical protein [Caudoviricetes sp.]